MSPNSVSDWPPTRLLFKCSQRHAFFGWPLALHSDLTASSALSRNTDLGGLSAAPCPHRDSSGVQG